MWITPISGMHAETTVMPGHEFFDKHIGYSAFSLEHGQDFGAEDLFQLLQVSFGQAIKDPVRSKQPIGDDGMRMGVESGVIPEDVDHHDHPEDAVIQTQHRAEEHLQALLGTVTKLSKELPVVFEIDAQHLRDAEDKLPMRNGVKDVVGDVLPELNRLLGMATGAEPPPLAGKGQKEFACRRGWYSALANPSCKSPHLRYSSTTSSTTGRKKPYSFSQRSS
jgi:hypothetical protein